MVSFLTAPTLPLLPETSPSPLKAGCHLLRPSKSLTVAHTLSSGALISTVSTTRRVFGGSPEAVPAASVPSVRRTNDSFIMGAPCDRESTKHNSERARPERAWMRTSSPRCGASRKLDGTDVAERTARQRPHINSDQRGTRVRLRLFRSWRYDRQSTAG